MECLLRVIFITVLCSFLGTYAYCDPEHKIIIKDGKTIDSWLYKDDKGVPIKWVRATNGKEFSWSYFKDGKAYIDEDDVSNTGKVNQIIVTVDDPDHKKTRQLLLVLDDKDKNVFVVKDDTNWKSLDK